MMTKKIIAAVAAAAIVLSALPAAAFASWVGDDAVDKGSHAFTCSVGGRMEVRAFGEDGSQLAFFERDGGYFIDGAGLADEYAEEGFTAAGDFLLIPESGEPVSITYAKEAFGRFELTALPNSGFTLFRFVDPECGCAKDFDEVNDVFVVTRYAAETIEAVFWEDDAEEAGDGAGDAATAASGMTMKLDGETVPTDVPPFIESGRTFVPVRFVSEALGARVAWDAGAGTVTATAEDGTVVVLKKGGMDILVQKGGQDAVVAMDVAAIAIEGRIFVPVRFIAEALGFKVGWDGPTKTVLLTTKAGPADREGALRFKQEYEALNGVLNDDGAPQYAPLSIDEENNVVYMDYGELVGFLKNGTGLLYFGRPGCPWCRRLVPIMLDFASEENVSVFYYDIEQDRAENNESYKGVLALLGDYLPTDTVTQKEGDAGFDPNLKRVAMPQLFFIRDGKVVGGLFMFEHEFLKDSETGKVMKLLGDKYALVTGGADDPAAPCDCE